MVYQLANSVFTRMIDCTVMQQYKMKNAKTFEAPYDVDITSKIYLVTGPTFESIGYFTALGLVKRNAKQVLLLGRRESALKEAIAQMRRKYPQSVTVLKYFIIDLSLFSTIESCVKEIMEAQPEDEKIDVIIENAGISPSKYVLNTNNIESAVATNCLGHYSLRRMLIEKNLFDPNHGRIVVITGDIYFAKSNNNVSLQVDFKNEDSLDSGIVCYARSKLGNIFIAMQLKKEYENIDIRIVHPSVAYSNLGNYENPIINFFRKLTSISAYRGAQMSLICATTTSKDDSLPYKYYTNVRNQCQFPDDDVALDQNKAKIFYEDIKIVYSKLIENNMYKYTSSKL